MENRIRKLEDCNERIIQTLVQIRADLQDNSNKTKEMHKVIMGNGTPEKGLLDRMARMETKMWIVIGVLVAFMTGVLDYAIRILFKI